MEDLQDHVSFMGKGFHNIHQSTEEITALNFMLDLSSTLSKAVLVVKEGL